MNTIHIDYPDINNTKKYSRHYYKRALKSIFRSHQFLYKEDLPSYQHQFTLEERHKEAWLKLFELTMTDKAVPLSYFSPSSIIALMQFLGDLGLNLKNVLHLRHNIHFPENGLESCSSVGAKVDVNVSLGEILKVGKNKIALEIKTSILQDAKALIVAHDHIIVKNLDLTRVKAPLVVSEGKTAIFKGLSRRKSLINKAQKEFELSFNEQMAWEYAKVSGDFNIVHTSNFMAKLFGYKGKFVQGMCSVNAIIKELTINAGLQLKSLDILFSRPVFLPQKMRLICSDHQLELLNEQGKVLLYGEYSYYN